MYRHKAEVVRRLRERKCAARVLLEWAELVRSLVAVRLLVGMQQRVRQTTQLRQVFNAWLDVLDAAR